MIYRMMTPIQARRLWCQRFSSIASVAMHSRSHKKYKFMQQSMGVQLWRQGASEKIFRTLNNYGMTQSKAAARSAVDKLGSQHDAQLKQKIRESEVRF